MVNSGRRSRLFTPEPDAPQYFVVAVNDVNYSMRQLLTEFSNFNRKYFKDKSLKLSQETMEGYRMAVIGSFANKAEALQYFTRVVTTRSLFSSLGTMGYRNFLISEGNLPKLMSTSNMENYMGFFSDVYLKDLSAKDEETEESSNASVAPAQTPAPKPKVQQTTYNGPFSTNFSGTHQFVMVLPKTGFTMSALQTALRKFNTTNFASINLQMEQAEYSSLQQLVLVKGFANDGSALEYLKRVVQSQEIFEPLEQLEYRNFIISDDNLKILLQSKNQDEYLQFYRQFYLGRP